MFAGKLAARGELAAANLKFTNSAVAVVISKHPRAAGVDLDSLGIMPFTVVPRAIRVLD